jgi:hypothetical protein
MSDDAHNVSARDWRAVREGEAHAAARTSTNTPESFIVGVGASGALLAGAAIVFVTLVGLVSFNVWPSGAEVAVDGNVELSQPTPSSPASPAAAPVSAASGQIASTTAGAGGGNAGGGNNQGGGKNTQAGNGSKPKSGVTSPPPTTTIPPTENPSGTGDTGSTPSTPGSASKSPTHPVHPVHPEKPHQNVPQGTKGREDPNGDDSEDVVSGKGPLTKPTPPSSAGSSNSSDSSSGSGSGNGNANGHNSPKSKH